MSHHRETVTAVGAPDAVGPYTHAVKAGGLIFCSGQIPLDPESAASSSATRPASRRAAASRTFRGRRRRGRLARRDAVKLTVYLTDMAAFAEVNEVYGSFFEGDPPARVAFGVAALPKGAQVEIDAILAVPD